MQRFNKIIKLESYIISNDHDDDGGENVSSKVNSCCFKIHRSDEFFWSWIVKDCIVVKKKKLEKVLFCSCSQVKLEISAWRRGRVTAATKYTKKCNARAKLLFC